MYTFSGCSTIHNTCVQGVDFVEQIGKESISTFQYTNGMKSFFPFTYACRKNVAGKFFNAILKLFKNMKKKTRQIEEATLD